MKTPITFFGGKQSIQATILTYFPEHEMYIEPFFGGGAVFFGKPKSKVEIINDIDDKLMNFYLATQQNFTELKSLIDNTLNSESQYKHAKQIWNNKVEATDIEKAWAIWMITNQSFGGSMHGGWKWSNYRERSHTGIYSANKRTAFSSQIHERLKHTQISSRDALRVIIERDSKNSFFYLDPPYPGHHQGHYRGYDFKKFASLLELLESIQGKFLLSNYWSQTLRYHVNRNKWNVVKIPTKTRIANFNTKSTYREEILVFNYNLENRLLFN